MSAALQDGLAQLRSVREALTPSVDSSGSNVVAQSPGLAKLACALVKAQQAAKSVEKDSANTFHRYKYASAEAIIDEARSALGSAGVACLSTGWRFAPFVGEAPARVSKDGKSAPLVIGRVYVQYLVLHESGEWMQFEASTPVIPESGRPEDKAEATALTYNAGYFLRGLLMLPRVEEGSQVDDRDDRHRQAPPPQHANGNAPPPAPSQAREERVAELIADYARQGREGTMAGHSALARAVNEFAPQGSERERLLKASKEAADAIRHRATSTKEAQDAFSNGGAR